MILTMFDPSQLLTFCLAALVLVVVPGPAVLFVIARSMEQGRLAGIVSIAGLSIGAAIHTLLAAFGLSAIFATSAVAFSIVKYAGALYLVYLGVKTLRERPERKEIVVEEKGFGRIIRDGIIVNLLNPKAALFFLAFLPQFTDPARGSVALQIVVLGLIFIAIAFCSDSVYAMLAGTFGALLKQSPRWQRRQKIASGSTYIALGVLAAFSSGNATSK